MNQGNLSKLLVPSRPWLIRESCSQSELTDCLWAFQRTQSDAVVRFLRGNNMTTARCLFKEFAAALQFPYYFGSNWDALDECLRDLSWLPANIYILVVFDCEEVLRQEPAHVDLLVEVLERACVEWSTPIAKGESWDRPAVPFHVVLQCADKDVHHLPPRFAGIADTT